MSTVVEPVEGALFKLCCRCVSKQAHGWEKVSLTTFSVMIIAKKKTQNTLI